MKNVWDESDIGELEKLTAKDVREAEEYFQVKLPKEYIKLLKVKNGGYLLKQALPVSFKNSWADDHVPLDFLFGIKKNEGIWDSRETLSEWGIDEDRFITLSGDGHTWIVLDYRMSSTEPEIAFIDIENGKTTVIFKSFKEMMENLYEHEDDDELLFDPNDNPNSLSRAKELLSSEDPGDHSRGLYTWAASYEELDGLAPVLINTLENEVRENTRMAAAELLCNLIGDGTFTEKPFINKVLNIMGNHEDLLLYQEILLDYLNEK